MSKEIEKQWIAEKGDEFNELEEISPIEIEQFYVKITDDDEIRYRKKKRMNEDDGGWVYKKTIKRGKGLTREENEAIVTAKEYRNQLGLHKVEGSNVIRKKRYTWKINGFTYEIDEFIQPPLDKVVVEVEFDDEDKAKGFELMADVLPSFFKNPMEVTEDERWKMKNVALNGFPES